MAVNHACPMCDADFEYVRHLYEDVYRCIACGATMTAKDITNHTNKKEEAIHVANNTQAQEDGRMTGTALSTIFTLNESASTEAIWYLGKCFAKWNGYSNIDNAMEFIQGFLIGIRGESQQALPKPENNR